MGLKAIIQSTANAFHSVGRDVTCYLTFVIQKCVKHYLDSSHPVHCNRSRRFVLIALLALGLLYFLGPYIFHHGRSKSIQEDPAEECVAENVAQFQSRLDSLDAFSSSDFETASTSNKLAYIGNGKIATALGSDNGLYIRIYRALSLPIKYWPVIQTHLPGNVKEMTVLNILSGLAYKIQVLATPTGCVNVGTVIYAHRSRPSLLFQDFHIYNPSHTSVTVELDQIGASGWEGLTVQEENCTIASGDKVSYKIYSGEVSITGSHMKIAIAIGAVTVTSNNVIIEAQSTRKLHFPTAVHYSTPLPEKDAHKFVPDFIQMVKEELEMILNMNEKILLREHTKVWEKLWHSGFSISTSLAEGALNGDRINKTLYYVLSNSPAPLHNVMSTQKEKLAIRKVLYFPDRCYEGHSTLVSETLWINPEDESQIARVVTTWMITLEKQGCLMMVQAGAEGILQAMILSLGPFHFNKQHLEMTSLPHDLHRDVQFRRINYGNNTHVNISVVVGDDNKATLFVALDRNDKPYYGCDAGCLDPPVLLSNEPHQFPVKLTDPVTSVLYITADKQHMEELKHAIHVKEIIEAPAHEHHVIALHKHGHHFGGLPTIFWVSIAFLITVFHLFLFKLIYNEYCQDRDKFTRSHYRL